MIENETQKRGVAFWGYSQFEVEPQMKMELPESYCFFALFLAPDTELRSEVGGGAQS